MINLYFFKPSHLNSHKLSIIINQKPNQKKIPMPKQVIVIMDDHYPFGQCEQSTSEMTRVLVRKIYEVSVQQRNKLLEKANILKKLKSQQLIKLQSVLEQQQTIHFLFQYVPIRLETWISNINDQFIQNFRDQVIKFSSYLANNFIKIDFKLKNIGMDHNYGAKYFLDPSFTYDPTLNKQKLKSQYIRDISNLFKPYIQNNQQEEKSSAYGSGVNTTKLTQKTDKNQNGNKNKNNSISPPTYEHEDEPVAQQTSTKTKQKLEKYYQHMNASMDVENQKILQEFMNVLDDEQEQQIHHPPTKNVPHPPPAQNKNIAQQNQYNFDAKQAQNKTAPKKPESIAQIQSQAITNPKPSQNNNAPKVQTQKQSQPGFMMAPPKMTKNSQIGSYQPEEEQVVWKDGDDLQDRIKKAIQNSKSIISRFKSIKESRS